MLPHNIVVVNISIINKTTSSPCNRAELEAKLAKFRAEFERIASILSQRSKTSNPEYENETKFYQELLITNRDMIIYLMAELSGMNSPKILFTI